MADNKKWDRSDSFIYTWKNSEGKKEYYATQLIFCNKTMLKEWDMEDEQTGYYAMMVNCKYDRETGKPYDANMLFSDLKLLVACGRRSQKNYELSMEKFSETVYASIEIMEKDRETKRILGATDDEIDNIIKKIREEYENEKMEKEDKMPMLRAEPMKNKCKNKEEKKEKKKVTFDVVAGMTEVNDVFFDVIDQLNNPEKYELFDIEPIRSLLMYGKPGVGKTYIANAFANMIDADFVKINMGDIASKYQGQTGNNIKKIFDDARASDKFTVLFWDEADAVANRRGADENSKEKNATLNVLLTEMSSDDNENIFMIFATNFVELLDPAFLRSKRCDIKIEIPLPNFETRLQVLELNSKKKPLGEDVNLEEVAERMEGFNCADMSLLCNQSARTALKKGKMEINQEDFLEALEKMNGSKKEEFKPKKIGFESQVAVVND